MAGERTDPCGCRWRRKDELDRWLVMCKTHEAEYQERHKRAMEDYRGRRDTVSDPSNPPTAEQHGNR